MPTKLLLPKQQYLVSGIHMGMKLRTKDMKEFIYKIRPDGLAILNLRKIDERIRIAARFLARCKNIIVASKKSPIQKGVKKFAEIIGAQAFTGRFLPGTLTNPSFKKYTEADVVFVLDPLVDSQAMEEATKARVPVVAVCNSFNETRNVDLIIPANNKGKKALATLLWLLAREILKERGEIKSDKDFKYKVEEFEEE
ncbi:MAG: 30S ribosomal protein S2 [Candidatus Aenigmatarchaeota archaeon]